MNPKRITAVAAAVGLASVTGLVVRGALPPKPEAAVPVVDQAVPEYRLLQDALDITAERRTGSPHFSYVPRDRPLGLLRMHSGGQGDAVTDGCQFGPGKLTAVVAFSERPAPTCGVIERGEAAGLCVRDSATSPGPAAAPFRHVVVYFTGNVAAAPDPGDPGTAAARRFWARTDLVPIGTAAWFADLVERGRASAAG